MSELERSAKSYLGPAPNRQWPVMVAICFLALAIAIHFIDFSDLNGGPIVRLLTDKAAIHITTLVCSLIAVGFAAYWFFNHPRVPTVLRWSAALIGIVSIVLLAVCFRVESFRGDLIPQFRLRWTNAHDRELAPISVSSKLVNLEKTTPQDFPQFLGPHRSLYLIGRRLSTDWSKNPPTKLWSRPIGAGWSAFSAVNGFAVTQEQRGDEELVTCYDIKSGVITWTNAVKARHETPLGYIGPRGTPTIHGGDVYTLGATGILQRVEGATGKTLWQKDLILEANSDPKQEAETIAWGRSASPLINENLVIVPLGGPKQGKTVSLVAYEIETGDKVWEAGDRQPSYASPKFVSIRDVQMILSVNEDNVSAHVPSTGKILWQHPWPGNSNRDANCSQPMVVDSKSVLLTKGYGQGSILLRIVPEDASNDRFKSEVVWTNHRALRTKLTNACAEDNFAFALSDGILQCVNTRSGDIEWKSPKRFGNGQVLGCDRLLLIQSESGEITLVQLSAERYTELGSFQGLESNSGPCWNNMCLYGNRLLLRNSQEAACWELPTHAAKAVESAR